MALHPGRDLPQARSAGKLAKQQRNQLILRAQAADPIIRTVPLDQAIEYIPRNPLQYIVQNAILMPHGVDPLSCPRTSPNALIRVESTPCTLST